MANATKGTAAPQAATKATRKGATKATNAAATKATTAATTAAATKATNAAASVASHAAKAGAKHGNAPATGTSGKPSIKRLQAQLGLATTLHVPTGYMQQNPKRPGTKAHARFALLQQFNGQTYGAFYKAWQQAINKGAPFTKGACAASEVAWCIAKGFVYLRQPK